MYRVVDTSLIDGEMVYAPRQGNDRLLLGQKGILGQDEQRSSASAPAVEPNLPADEIIDNLLRRRGVVVDPWAFSHEVPNTGVLGASVMSTSGASSSTLTA